MNYSPIEKFPGLLQEYGRAIVWFNLVELGLDSLLRGRGGLGRLSKLILNDMMVGKKISLIENAELLDKKIISDLRKLSDRRTELAHGTTGERVLMTDPKTSTEVFSISHKGKEIPLTKEYLEETTNLARELAETLRQELLPPHLKSV